MDRERILKLIEIKFPNLTPDMKEEYFIEIMCNIRKTGYEDIEKRIKKIEIKERINYKK
jgi:hypothetical protein